MLKVTGLHKTYRSHQAEVHACRGIDFEVRTGEILSLVGPSGCGKTTALRCVAGLEHPDQGSMTLGRTTLFDSRSGAHLSAHRRSIGMVFQSYAIWPHMSVAGNVGYALQCLPRQRRPSRAEIRRRVLDVLGKVRIEDLADRPASALSGGQQQRVAIARALLRNADLLLFDEPLSNLDAKLREEMRSELRLLFQETGTAVLYVTHDLSEALAVSDRLLVLQDGQIVQAGRPEEIYRRPRSEFVAGFLGNANLLPGRVVERVGAVARVESALGSYQVDAANLDGHDDVFLLARPSDLRVLPITNATTNCTPAVVEASLFLGTSVEYRVRVGAMELRASGDPSAERAKPGDAVALDLDARSVVAVPRSDRPAPDPIAAAAAEPAPV